MPPLRSTRKRGADKRPRRSKRPTTVVDEANIAALYAAGVSKRRIVDVMDVARSSVDEILARPDVVEYANRLRAAVRLEAQTRIQQLTGKVYDWVDEVATSRDSKAFDNVMRGLVALERVSASTSGDANKTQTQVTVTRGDLSAEAQALVEALAASGAKVANA